MTRPRRTGSRSGGADIPPMTESQRKTHEIANRKTEIRTGGKTSEVTLAEAVQLKQLEAAMKGSPLAQRDVLRRFQEAEQAQRAEIDAQNAVWTHRKALLQHRYDKAKAAGLPEPADYPHPDDIIIGEGKPVRVIGPRSAEDEKSYKTTIALREAFLLQFALDETYRPRDADDEKVPAAMVMAMLLNHGLPPRMKRGMDKNTEPFMMYRGRTKRWLETETRAAWRRVGITLPRGTTMGNSDHWIAMLEMLAKTSMKLLRDGPENPQVEDIVHVLEAPAEEIKDRFGTLYPVRHIRGVPVVAGGDQSVKAQSAETSIQA